MSRDESLHAVPVDRDLFAVAHLRFVVPAFWLYGTDELGVDNGIPVLDAVHVVVVVPFHLDQSHVSW